MLRGLVFSHAAASLIVRVGSASDVGSTYKLPSSLTNKAYLPGGRGVLVPADMSQRSLVDDGFNAVQPVLLGKLHQLGVLTFREDDFN